jgi:hypothetical protein
LLAAALPVNPGCAGYAAILGIDTIRAAAGRFED